MVDFGGPPPPFSLADGESRELTLRFVLKVFTIAVIAAGLFLYYLRDLRMLDRDPPA